MTSQQVPQVFTNFEASLQEEVDCNDMVEPEYNYNDPNHKPPFKYVDYTEVKANEDNEINCIAFGKKENIYVKLQKKIKLPIFIMIEIQIILEFGVNLENLIK